MSLARSRELKNLNNKNKKNNLKTYIYASTLLFFPQLAHAQERVSEFAGSDSIINILLSLCLVIVIIFSLAWLARRFNVAQAGNGQLKIVASLLAGSKEKIMVIEIGDEQHLLGITANNISHLAKLDKPITNAHTSKNSNHNPSHSFHTKLIDAMAQNMRGSKEKGIM